MKTVSKYFDKLQEETISRFSVLYDYYDYDALRNSISSWLIQQLKCTYDRSYAQLFSKNIDISGVKERDYLQKLLLCGDGIILAGIRFYNLDIKKPFVDIVAFSGSFDWSECKRLIKQQWAMFNPERIRILHHNNHKVNIDCSLNELDQTVHIGKLRDVIKYQSYSNIELVRSLDPAKTACFVNECYQMIYNQGYVRTKATPANLDELSDCLINGTLHEAYLDNKMIGVFATRWGNIDFIEGHVVIEEVIHPSFHGMGIAKQIQATVALKIYESKNANNNLIGTIHEKNIASQKTATGVGRKAILCYEFFDIIE
ncbi:MAG: hypothetical protein U7M05_01785 [Candidatus Igneacidithiobacillus chanchocoensis]